MCIACLARGAANSYEYHRILGDESSQAAGQNFTTAAGVQNIDALLFGTRWSSTNLTYTFPKSGSYYPNPYGEDQDYTGTFLALTAQMKTAFRSALAQYASVSGLLFTEVGASEAADLTGARTTSGDADFTADARFPTWDNEGDIWFNDTSYDTPTRGNYAWATVLHEIGHTLGLKHGHQSDYGPARQALTADRDSMEFSIMTYRSYVGGGTDGYTNEAWGYAQTPMMLDIAAIQQMYGANFATNAGNTIYSFSPATGEMFIDGQSQGRPGDNRIFLTIWDGDGIDTYDFSNYSVGTQISLEPGSWSLLSVIQRACLDAGQLARANVYNALQFHEDARSLIENASGGSGSDTIGGNQTANVLNGNAGNDMLTGQGGNDRLIGGAGNDVLRGDFTSPAPGFGTGYLTLPPGTTNNTAQTALNITGTFSLANDPDIANSTTIPHTTVNAAGNGQAAYYMVALKAGMTITFDIDHTAGVDLYVQLQGANAVVLAENDDTTPSDPGSTPLAGETMTQDSRLSFTVNQDGNYYLQVGSFNEITNGFAPLIPEGAPYELNVSVASPGVLGIAGNDTLLGGLGTDLLYGDAGNDVLNGGADADQLFGDAGNDVLAGGSGGDRLFGGIGINTASYSNAAGSVVANLANTATNTNDARGDAYSAIQNLLGSIHADQLVGNVGANVLDGFGGNDTLIGGTAGDRLVGGAGIDTASYAGAGKGVVASLAAPSSNTNDARGDTYVTVENLSGTGLGDTLIGNSGANTLHGGASGDKLSGGNGNDVLYGGIHNDTLTGGANDDVFVFNTTPSATNNMDTITDYNLAADKMHLENAIFTTLTTLGTLAAAKFWKSTAGVAHDADDRIIYDTDTGRLFYDYNGIAAGGAAQFADLAANLALTNADFVVI